LSGRVRGRWGTGPNGPVYVPTPPRRPAGSVVGRWVWRHRRKLAPIPVAAGYALLNAAQLGNPRVLVVAALAAPCLAWWAWMAVLGRDTKDRTPATVLLAAVTIAALQVWWLLPDAWLPPGLLFALTAASVAASAWRFRIRPHPEPEAPVNNMPWEAARWDEMVGCAGGALPGSVAHYVKDLYAPDTDTPVGFLLAVQLVAGRQEVSHLRGRLGVIAGVYGAPKAGTVIDEVGDETRALLTITTRKFLAEVKTAKGPTLDPSTGRFILQTLGDGSPGHWQFWAPRQGIKHGWLVGAIGGGKSGALDCLLMNLLVGGFAVADIVDLKGGASIPHWQHRAFRYGTTIPAGIAALRRGVAVCDYRNDLMARMPAVDPDTGEPVLIDGKPAHGRTWIDPSPQWPIYAVVIEEEPQLVKDPTWGPVALTLMARIAALGRQCLVMLIVTSQGANLDEAFGGVRILRTNVQAGNVLVLWTDQGSGNLATATRTVDLSRIPAGQPGVGFLVGPGQPRDLQGRVRYVDRPWDAVQAAEPGVLGPDVLAFVAAADVLSAGGTLTDAIGAALAPFPDDPEWADVVTRVLGPAPASSDTPQAPDADTPPAALTATPDQPGRPAGQAAILAHLEATGGSTAAELRAFLGSITDQALRRHLDPLLEEGKVERVGHGRYALTQTDQPREATP
jgi:hypothetical protein